MVRKLEQIELQLKQSLEFFSQPYLASIQLLPV